ncbi:transcriptional regulator Spx [Melissococcus plutonius DAT561]|nr:transcriptional regulator Spx [Melissococcus plutonius DAT561]
MDHDIEFVEKNIFREPLSDDELKHILELTENGTTDIISTRSIAYQKLDIDFDALTLNELITLLKETPSLLRRPLLIDELCLNIGFNEDEIRVFLPKEVRKQELSHILLFTGMNN